MDKRSEAFKLAKAAATLDFKSAIDGLMAGHAATLESMQKRISDVDSAFLMALCLTERGAKLDKAGTMEQTIAKGLMAMSGLSTIEEKFLKAFKGNSDD